MKILAVDTATEACSVALYQDGEIKHQFRLAPREHTKLILPMIDGILAEAGIGVSDLDAIAFGRGPGSFTGVRIATGITHGIAFGADLPVLPISNLAALAQQGLDKFTTDLIFTAIDARMEEVYWAEYSRNESGLAQLVGVECVTSVSLIDVASNSGYGMGSAWGRYHIELTDKLQTRIEGYDESSLPRAKEIAKLAAVGFANGEAVSVEQAMPVYLRDKVAKKQSER